MILKMNIFFYFLAFIFMNGFTGSLNSVSVIFLTQLVYRVIKGDLAAAELRLCC